MIRKDFIGRIFCYGFSILTILCFYFTILNEFLLYGTSLEKSHVDFHELSLEAHLFFFYNILLCNNHVAP